MKLTRPVILLGALLVAASTWADSRLNAGIIGFDAASGWPVSSAHCAAWETSVVKSYPRGTFNSQPLTSSVGHSIFIGRQGWGIRVIGAKW
jgi:hypothetical protein